MEENINNRWICVQCACHLENSFKFCPKCGLKLSQSLNKETSARSVENDQLSLFAKPRKSTQRARLIPSNATVSQRVSSNLLHQALLFRPDFNCLVFQSTRPKKKRSGEDSIFGGEKKKDVFSRSTWLFQWESWEKTRNQGEARPFQ